MMELPAVAPGRTSAIAAGLLATAQILVDQREGLLSQLALVEEAGLSRALTELRHVTLAVVEVRAHSLHVFSAT